MKVSHSLDILFENRRIIVINKPSGMLFAGHPAFMNFSLWQQHVRSAEI